MPKRQLTAYIYYMNENVMALRNSADRDLADAVHELDKKWKSMSNEEKNEWRERLRRVDNEVSYRLHWKLLRLISEAQKAEEREQQRLRRIQHSLEIPKTYADIPRMRQENKQLLLTMWNFQMKDDPEGVMRQIYYMGGVWKVAELGPNAVELCITGFTPQEGVVCCFYDYYETGDPQCWTKITTDVEEATYTHIDELCLYVPLINYVAFEKLIKTVQAYKVPVSDDTSVKVFYAEDFFIALKSWIDDHHEALSDHHSNSTAYSKTPVPRIRCPHHRASALVRGGPTQCCPVDFIAYLIGSYFNYLRQAMPGVHFARAPLAYFRDSMMEYE